MVLVSEKVICGRPRELATMAEPGFPRGGAPTPRGGGGAPTYDFAKFSQKLHEIERIWTPRAPPRSATELSPGIFAQQNR